MKTFSPYFFSLLTCCLFTACLLSCGSQPDRADAEAIARATRDSIVKANEQKEFYPLASYISSETAYLDSMPLAVLYFREQDGARDSGILDKKKFQDVARLFSESDISGPDKKKAFMEQVYMDETINAVTMSYTPLQEDNEVRKMDIWLNPNNDRVRNVYIEKSKQLGDTALLYKLFWTTHKNCQVVTIREVPKQPASTTIERYVWDQ